MSIVGKTYYEKGQPVVILIQWKRTTTWLNKKGNKVGGPKNVLIRRADGTEVVRPFRGLRKAGDLSNRYFITNTNKLVVPTL
jgi:hypothetical protein